ncbi:MAG TPA: YbaN family protein [Bacteroidales bacterium]|nr:YbaN family protein [Bacteroidales bacterium]
MTEDLPPQGTSDAAAAGTPVPDPSTASAGKRKHLPPGWRFLFLVMGSLSVVLGIIGIVVPGLPTTAFLLLAAYLFARSSERMRLWLLHSPLLGRYIRDYQERGGVTPRTRLRAIVLIWSMIGLSTWLFIENRTVDILVILLGGIGTLVMGFLVPSARK